MVKQSDAQHFEESQGIIEEESRDNCEENDLDYDEYEKIFEPPADEKSEMHHIIVMPQMPSIRNLFIIFCEIMSNRDDENEAYGKIGHKRSLTEDDVMVNNYFMFV